MKKIIVTLFALILGANISFARDPHRGYRGFVDWDVSIGSTTYYSCADGGVKHESIVFMGPSTTHGYQFNTHCFLGAGAMLSLAPMAAEIVPVFADFRYDVKFGKFTPFADAKVGYDFASKGVYFNPAIGYRCGCGRKANINIGLGVIMRDRTQRTWEDLPFWDAISSTETYRTKLSHHFESFISLRIGVDF